MEPELDSEDDSVVDTASAKGIVEPDKTIHTAVGFAQKTPPSCRLYTKENNE